VNKNAIHNTAITYWSEEDDCFIVESPLMDSLMGAGDTPEDAQREFKDILSDAYEAYLEGRMTADRPGRPAKNLLALNTDVRIETRENIKELAKEKGCSQGEVIDYLLAFHQHFATIVAELHSGDRDEAYKIVLSRLRSRENAHIVAEATSQPYKVSSNIDVYTMSADTTAQTPTSTKRTTQKSAPLPVNRLEELERRVSRMEAVLFQQKHR